MFVIKGKMYKLIIFKVIYEVIFIFLIDNIIDIWKIFDSLFICII